MPSTSIFPSSESEKRWRDHMRDIYDENHDIRPCVFQLPDNLRETKPEAYIPQIVGLGPYHHFRPEVQLMTSKKRDAVGDYLDIEGFDGFIKLIDQKGKELDFITRSCYDRYLDLEEETLSWIVVVDGTVLLHFIDTYLGPEEEKQEIYSDVEKLVPDVFMLENQIPIILLLKVREILGSTFNVKTDVKLFDKFFNFCDRVSPLELTSVEEWQPVAFDDNKHMLHFLYQMIMKNKGPALDNDQGPSESESGDDVVSEGENRDTSWKKRVGVLAKQAADVGGELFYHVIEEFNSALLKAENSGVTVPGNIRQVSQLLQNLEKTFQLSHNKQIVYSGDKLEIPSACRLLAILNVKFMRLPDRHGIENICLIEDKKNNYKFYLPEITVGASSEVIFRNLVAYEAMISKELEGSTRLRDFVDLICGLIKSEKDVQFLRDAKIITGELSDQEIVNICNGIKKSEEKPDDKSRVHKTAKDANDYFQKSIFVKSWKGFTNAFAFVLKAIFRPLFPFFIIVLLGFQSACQIFDCKLRPNGVAGNPYLGELNPQAKIMLPRKLLPY